jgi:glucosamine-phosphate N-acetyltransferase
MIREATLLDLRHVCDVLECAFPNPKIDFDDWKERQSQGIHTFVGIKDREVIATYSVLLERKIIHNGGLVGHLEDFAILPEFRGLGYGKQMIEHIIEFCKEQGCYKVIHNCQEELVPYYEKYSKMRVHEVSMRRDL